MVAHLDEMSASINGYLYDETGKSTPAAPDDFAVLDRLGDLRDAMLEPGKGPWKACLVYVNRVSGRITLDFEYNTPGKWLITPANVKQMAEILRPNYVPLV